MEEGIKEEGGPRKASGAAAGQASKMSKTVGAMEDATFKSIGDVLKLLPTATVIVYQVLNPIVTNAGACHVGYKIATGILIGLCGFFCAFSTFADSSAAPTVGDMPKSPSSQYGLKAQEDINLRGIRVTNGHMR